MTNSPKDCFSDHLNYKRVKFNLMHWRTYTFSDMVLFKLSISYSLKIVTTQFNKKLTTKMCSLMNNGKSQSIIEFEIID